MLKIWLPLDGDLRNLGCNDINVTGGIINNSGKIGKCYSVDSSNKITITHNLPTTSEFSISFWMKVPTAASKNTSWEVILSYSAINNANNNSSSIWVSWAPYQELKIYGTSNQQWLWASPLSHFSYDTWHHWTITHTANGAGVKCCIYIDGKLINTYNNTEHPVKIIPGTIYLGSGITVDKFYFNDFRIYDHCLSAAEVREIAMGLVLHYKLDGTNVKTGTNLISNIRTGNRTTKLTDGKNGVITNGTQGDTYFWADLNETITSGTTYKLSFNASGITEGARWIFSLENQSDASYYLYIYNGYNEYTFTAGSINWRTNTLLIDDKEQLDYANPATFWDFQLYKLSNTTMEVKDSSGYGHNGTINGVLTTSTNTSRYNNSCIFNGTDNAIQIHFNDIIKDQNYTISVWIYKTSIGSKSYQTILGGPSGFELEARNAGGTDPQFVGWNWGKPTTTYEFNKWTLFTFVHTPSNSKLYVNGELKATGNAATIPTGNYYIGAWNTATQQNYEGQMSDFRIYCTPLLDNDIKMLYNIGMKVDNLGGVHTFEFNEKDNNLLAGTMITSNFSNKIDPYTKYNSNGELYFDTNGSSAGSNYIPINPTNHTYYYDFDISVNAGNQFYIGFERYDANKTSRSNDACNYIYASNSSTDINHKHIFGTVNLSTDGINPCAFIALRILNGWSVTTSGVVGTATIHSMSLREISTIQNPKSYKNGILSTGEFKEYQKAAFYKNGFIESTEFIEI